MYNSSAHLPGKAAALLFKLFQRRRCVAALLLRGSAEPLPGLLVLSLSHVLSF